MIIEGFTSEMIYIVLVMDDSVILAGFIGFFIPALTVDIVGWYIRGFSVTALAVRHNGKLPSER